MKLSCRAVGLVLSLATVLPAWASTGQSLYKTKCAGCHGANGEESPRPSHPR